MAVAIGLADTYDALVLDLVLEGGDRDEGHNGSSHDAEALHDMAVDGAKCSFRPALMDESGEGLQHRL